MFLIVGSNSDDVLYFESVMRNKREEVALNKYRLVIGTIFDQEVLLLKDVYTSFLSATLTGYLIEKYFILLVFNVGKCLAYSKTLKCGDIVICRQTVLGDVDQIGASHVELGQIPSLPTVLPASVEINTSLEGSLNRISYSRSHLATFVSSNLYNPSQAMLNRISQGDKVLGFGGSIVFDSEIGGIAVACHLFDIPYVALKVVEGVIGQKPTIDDYTKVLRQYSDAGKTVIATIGEIGRGDIINGAGN